MSARVATSRSTGWDAVGDWELGVGDWEVVRERPPRALALPFWLDLLRDDD
jgi:hypothetical protein